MLRSRPLPCTIRACRSLRTFALFGGTMHQLVAVVNQSRFQGLTIVPIQCNSHICTVHICCVGNVSVSVPVPEGLFRNAHGWGALLKGAFGFCWFLFYNVPLNIVRHPTMLGVSLTAFLARESVCAQPLRTTAGMWQWTMLLPVATACSTTPPWHGRITKSEKCWRHWRTTISSTTRSSFSTATTYSAHPWECKCTNTNDTISVVCQFGCPIEHQVKYKIEKDCRGQCRTLWRAVGR